MIYFAKNKKEKGIAIVYAVLVTSVLLLVAMGIAQIEYKELVFSLEAKDSDRAIFAADTGIECAMYMDSMQAFSGTSTDPFYCHGINVNVSQVTSTTYQFSLGLTPTSCAQVYIDKASGTAGTSTQIDSYGYNVGQEVTTLPQACLDSTSLTQNIVNRALEITYSN